MPGPTTEAPPSHWAVTEEFSKNVVTLAGVLLGITVTFATGLIGKAGTEIATRYSLFIAWSLSVLAIACGVAAHGFLVRYLKDGSGDKVAVFFGNAAFYFLIGSAVAFAVFGILVIERGNSLDAPAIIEKATSSMPVLSGDKTSTWKLKSMVFDPTKNAYDLVVVKENSTDTFSLTIDGEGRIMKAARP